MKEQSHQRNDVNTEGTFRHKPMAAVGAEEHGLNLQPIKL